MVFVNQALVSLCSLLGFFHVRRFKRGLLRGPILLFLRVTVLRGRVVDLVVGLQVAITCILVLIYIILHYNDVYFI